MGDPGWEALKAQFWPGVQDAGHDASTLLSGAANGIVDTPQLIAHALKQFVAQSLQNTTGEGAETAPPAQLPPEMQPGEFSPVLSSHLPQSEVRNAYDSEFKGYGNTIGQLAGPAVVGKGLEGLTALEGSGDAAGAFGNQAGAIRFPTDYMGKDVAAARADQMLHGVEDVPEELRTALAKHILKHGGKADDPIDALPLQGENSRQYGSIEDLSGDYYRFRRGQEDLPKAGEGTWGAAMAKMLGFSPMSNKAIFGGRGVEGLDNPIIRQNVEQVFEGTGVPPQYWPKQYAAIPEDSVVFKHPDPHDGDWRGEHIFGDLVNNLAGADLKGKSFPDMVKMGNSNYAEALRKYQQAQVGKPTGVEFPDGSNWQQLNAEQLKYEGEKCNHCIGWDSQKYVKNVASGKGNAYSLRDADNKPLVTVYSEAYDGGPETIEQIKGHSNSMQAQYLPQVDELVKAKGMDPGNVPHSDYNNMLGLKAIGIDDTRGMRREQWQAELERFRHGLHNEDENGNVNVAPPGFEHGDQQDFDPRDDQWEANMRARAHFRGIDNADDAANFFHREAQAAFGRDYPGEYYAHDGDLYYTPNQGDHRVVMGFGE